MNSHRRSVTALSLCLRLALVCVLALGAPLCAAAEPETLYTVQPGDHPWNIAKRYLLTPALGLRLARHNGIRNDRLIPPGTTLRIPVPWMRLQETRVRLANVHGEVALVAPDGSMRAAVQGETWLAGTLLRTGAQSTAQLEFDDGSQALVRQLTQVRLLQAQRPVLGDGNQVQLEMVRGAVDNLVRPAKGPGGRFEIRTPAAIAAVRGTQFRVSATERQTRAEVIDGEVLVRNDIGQSTTAAGTGTLVDLGASPALPRPLLAAPDLSALPGRLERLPIDWPVTAVAGGAAYRTQLAASSRFDALLSDEVTTPPRVRITASADGNYVLRVRAIDAQGLEGQSAERSIEVFTQPAPPFLIEPAPAAQVLAARPVLRWTRADPTAGYRVQIFRAGAPDTEPLEDQLLGATAQSALRADLEPGLYRWRIAAIDPARQRQGPWSDNQPFRRVLPGPGVIERDAQGDATTLSWASQPHARAYHMQLAGDPSFGTVLADVVVATPAHRLQKLAPGNYHVRVQTIGADGFTGPWGDVQSFTVSAPEPEPTPPDWRPYLLVLPLLLLML